MSTKMKTTLFLLLSFVAVTSLLISISLMSIPDGSILRVPLFVLSKSSFKDFRIPGLLMFVFVSIVNIVAVFYNMTRHLKRYDWSLWGGILVVLWVVVQYLFIEHYFLVDVFYFIVGIMIILLSIQLKGKSLI